MTKKITHKSKDRKDKHGYRLERKTEFKRFHRFGVSVEFYDPYTKTWRESILRPSEVEPIGLI